MSLNPEPADPEQRAQLDLAPKSYADAAEEALEPQSHANGTDGTVEDTKHKLRSKMDPKANGIHVPSLEDTRSLEGVGQDATPKSPTVKGHHRRASRGSKGSPGRKHHEHHEHGEHGDMIVMEKHVNGHGHALMTVKPSQEL